MPSTFYGLWFWGVRGAARLRVWVRPSYPYHSCICSLISIHLQKRDCVLAVYQGCTNYPGRQMHDGEQIYIEVERVFVYAKVYIILIPLPFGLCCFENMELWVMICRLGSFLCGHVSSCVMRRIQSLLLPLN